MKLKFLLNFSIWLAVNKLENVNASVDTLIKCCNLDVTVNGENTNVLLSSLTVDVMLENLKLARSKMEELANSPYNYT